MTVELRTEIPGPNSRAIVARKERVVAAAKTLVAPVVIDRGAGCTVTDVDGNTFLDWSGGIGCLNVGHTNPRVTAALHAQVDRFLHTDFTILPYESYVELAERLVERTPISGPQKAAFFNSGAEAVENAVKIARHATGRQAVIAFEGAFHGRTLMAMSLTSKQHPYKAGMGPFAPEVYRAPAPYPYRGISTEDALAGLDFMFKATIDPQEVACVILEPVQGEGGFTVMPPEFIQGLKERCERHGILYIDDEVQSGMGRTGTLWGIEHSGVVPDLMTVGKSLASGMPLAGVVGRAEVIDSVHLGGLGSTYGGNPVACAAAIESIKAIVDPAFLAQSVRMGEHIQVRLRQMAGRIPAIGEVRGVGPMAAIELVTDHESREPAADVAAATVAGALERGLLLLKTGIYDNVLRVLVPISATDDDLETGLNRLEESLVAAS